jgi:hypothetical protein
VNLFLPFDFAIRVFGISPVFKIPSTSSFPGSQKGKRDYGTARCANSLRMSWENQPARQAHQYLRGETAKLLTLFRPATGELRADAVQQSTNAILHPWLKRELADILKHCPPASSTVPTGRRWQDWDISPAADQLDRFFPPVRILLSLRQPGWA